MCLRRLEISQSLARIRGAECPLARITVRFRTPVYHRALADLKSSGAPKSLESSAFEQDRVVLLFLEPYSKVPF